MDAPVTPLLFELQPEQFRQETEYPIYAALKLRLCERLSKERNAAAIQSRWLHAQLAKASRSGTGIAELHGVTSHFIRERLRNLNHGTFLIEVGTGLRNSLTYVWGEPIGSETLRPYRELRASLGEHVPLGLDVLRVADQFGTAPFEPREFQSLFIRLRDRLLVRPKYKLVAESASADFARFMRSRQGTLLGLGLLEDGRRGMHLTPKGQWVGKKLDEALHGESRLRGVPRTFRRKRSLESE